MRSAFSLRVIRTSLPHDRHEYVGSPFRSMNSFSTPHAEQHHVWTGCVCRMRFERASVRPLANAENGIFETGGFDVMPMLFGSGSDFLDGAGIFPGLVSSVPSDSVLR